MGSDKTTPAGGSSRDARLKQALKANLQRRKAQARVRAGTAAKDSPEGACEDRQDTGDRPGEETGQDG